MYYNLVLEETHPTDAASYTVVRCAVELERRQPCEADRESEALVSRDT